MKIFSVLKSKLLGVKKPWLIGLAVLVLAGSGLAIHQLLVSSRASQVTYETTTVEKGTLVSSISSSGTITSGNYTNVTTKVSGIVTKVYVTNGDTVVKGQKIADITLDDYAKERQTTAWVNYLAATEAVKSAVNDKAASDISMWTARQEVLDAQQALDDMTSDNTNPKTHEAYTDGEKMIIIKTLDQKRKAFTVAESKYLDADARISAATAHVASALRSYQENSSTIVSPASGKISDLSLAEGITVTANSSTSSTSGATIVSSQTVGKINDTSGQLIATVSLTEVDITKVKANQKVTLALDAYEDKTFTGKVLAVNTSGSVSSGVTSYPVTILLDPTSVDIYPNMAVSAEIITAVRTDVISIPTSAITTVNGQSTVQIKKNNQISAVTVETGISNDTNTEITSGLTVGDVVVTSIVTPSTPSTSSTTSPFSGLNRSGSSTRGNNSGSRTFIQMGPGGF